MMQSMFSVAVRAMVGKRGAKALFAAAILAAMALVLAACGGGNGGTDDVNEVEETPAGTVTITLWHSMGAPLDGAGGQEIAYRTIPESSISQA